jgi:Meiotically up-regulated gene 113
MDAAELLAMLAEDDFGLLELPATSPAPRPEDRLRAAYEEIADFTRQYGRAPAVNPSNIGETKLAMRLKAMCENDDQRLALEPIDDLGLLAEPEPPATIEEAVADDPFGLLAGDDELFSLRHVPKSQTMPPVVARRQPCDDFESFRHLFLECHAELRSGARKLLPFRNPSQIEPGRFFVQGGVLLYVAEVGERTHDEIKKANARTRCVFENGTESNLLLQSLASNLYKGGKRVTVPDATVSAEMGLRPDTPMASVYVLRSLSDDPQVKALTELHKIGSTSATAHDRVARAASDTTFLGAPVEIVEEYRVPRGAERKLEAILHRMFASARVDAWFERQGRATTEANEWFAVPFRVIEEAVSLIESDAIMNYEYDTELRRLRLRSSQPSQ